MRGIISFRHNVKGWQKKHKNISKVHRIISVSIIYLMRWKNLFTCNAFPSNFCSPYFYCGWPLVLLGSQVEEKRKSSTKLRFDAMCLWCLVKWQGSIWYKFLPKGLQELYNKKENARLWTLRFDGSALVLTRTYWNRLNSFNRWT